MLDSQIQDAQLGPRPKPALLAVAHPVAILLSGIVAGAIVGTWLGEASFGSSAEQWTAYHQAVTSAYTRAVPPVGGLALVAALAALAGSWRQPGTRWLVLAAVACLLIGLLVTLAVHFPINADIATWQVQAPPADWQQVRDRWLSAHALRSVLAIAGFAVLVVSYRRQEIEPN